MKTLITIILSLFCFIANAQVASYKVNNAALLNSFKSGQISKETYIDIAQMQLSSLNDSIKLIEVKPKYNATIDLTLLAGGIIYQKFGHNVKYDYILHSWGGYFATKAMIYGLNKAGMSKTACILLPFITTSALCLVKEYMIDSSPSKGDLYAGIGGATLATISYTIDIEKLFKQKK